MKLPHEAHADHGTVLSPKAAAVVTSDDMKSLKMLLPGPNQHPDHAIVPDMVIYLSAMFLRSQDPDFVKEQIKWFKTKKN